MRAAFFSLPLLLLAFLPFALPFPAFAHPKVTTTQVMQQEGGERLVLTLDQPVTYKRFFTLDHPARLVLDLPTVDGQGVGLPSGSSSGLIRHIRSGQFDPETTRIVIELSQPAASVRIDPQEGRVISVVVMPPAGAISSAPASPAPSRAAPPILASAGNGRVSTRGNSRNGGHVTPPAPVAAPALPVIVIDAGHGGKDPGAAGRRQTQEKNVTLRYARILRDALAASGRYRPVLTRDDDRFVLLGERVRIGERAAGKAFISLHADVASMQGARGLSVYTVAEAASDAEAQKLADQENSVDILAGFKVNVDDQEAAGILLDLAQRETKNKASELADLLVGSFSRDGIRLLPSPHRFAGFRVLKAPDVPSVLIETGFLSNEEDERQLNTDLYPKKLAADILRGLDAYFARHPVKR